MLAIHERRPKQMSILDCLDAFIEHRREIVIRRTRYLLKKAELRAENLEAYLLALGHLDDFIKIIRDSKNRDEARERLKKYDFPVSTAESLGILVRSQPSIQGDRYVFTDRQVNAILELRLYQLTGLERDKVKGEYDNLLLEIKDFLDILAKESRVLAIIKEELLEIKEKHAGKGVKGMDTKKANQSKEDEQDFVEHLFSAQAHDYLMFFTNTGRVYVERVYGIPEGSRASKGRSIKNVLNLQTEESIAATLRIERQTSEDGEDVTFADGNGFILFATRSGKVKKTSLSDFKNYRKDGIIAIKLDDGNTLIDVRLTSGDDEVILVTRKGLSLRFSEDQARSQGRATAGVAGIKPVGDDYVVGMAIVNDDGTLLVAAENGIGKRSPFVDYRSQSRGGKGIITMKCTDKTGDVVGASTVFSDDELMLMTSDGQSIRIRCADIREAGRNTQGVKLVTMKDEVKLQDIACVIADDEDISESESDDGETDGE